MSDLKWIDVDYNWNGSLGHRLGDPPGAVVHYTGASSASPLGIHAYHVSLGWRGFAYMGEIRKDGRLYRGRPLWAMGGHTYHYGHWLGIVVELGPGEEPTSAQWATLIAVLKEWRDTYGPSFRIAGHREMPANSTDCPGRISPDKVRTAVAKPPVNIVALKQAMLAYAKQAEPRIVIPEAFGVNENWGPGAQTLMWRVSGRLHAAGKVPQTSRPLDKVADALKVKAA